jgi:hypothetical protein
VLYQRTTWDNAPATEENDDGIYLRRQSNRRRRRRDDDTQSDSDFEIANATDSDEPEDDDDDDQQLSTSSSRVCFRLQPLHLQRLVVVLNSCAICVAAFGRYHNVRRRRRRRGRIVHAASACGARSRKQTARSQVQGRATATISSQSSQAQEQQEDASHETRGAHTALSRVDVVEQASTQLVLSTIRRSDCLRQASASNLPAALSRSRQFVDSNDLPLCLRNCQWYVAYRCNSSNNSSSRTTLLTNAIPFVLLLLGLLEISYERTQTVPEGVCRLVLALEWPTNGYQTRRRQQLSHIFTVLYHPSHAPDYLVLASQFDRTKDIAVLNKRMRMSFPPNHWYYGTIIAQQARDRAYPTSPWESLQVAWYARQ